MRICLAFPIVIFMSLLNTVSGFAEKPKVPSIRWSASEDFVWSHLINGTAANLSENCPELFPLNSKDGDDNRWQEACRNISAEFVHELLTTSPYQEALPHQGVQIYDARISGDLDLDSAELTRELWISNSRIAGTITLLNARSKNLVGFDRTCVEGEFHAEDLKSTGSLILHDTIFARGLAISLTTIDGNLDLTGANIRGPFTADSLQVRNLLMNSDTENRAQFEFVVLRNAKIDGDVQLIGANVAGSFDATSLKAHNIIMSSDTKNKVEFESVALRNAEIDGDIQIIGATVAGPINAGSLHAHNLLMNSDARNKASFKEVSLVAARIDGAVNMEGADLLGNLTGDGLQAGMLLMNSEPLRKANFSGVELRTAKIATNFEIVGANVTGPLDGDHMTVGSNLNLRDGIFHGPLTLVLGHFGNLDLRSSAFTDLDLAGSVIVADLLLGRHAKEVSGTDQPMAWETDCHKRPGVRLPGLNLRNTQIGGLQDELDAWPKLNCLHLDGITVSRLGGFTRPNVLDAKSRDPTWWDEHWARLDSDFSPAPYTQLANAFSLMGDRDAADDVRFLERVHERQSATSLGKWSTEVVLEYVAGFGVGTYTFRVIYWIVDLTVVGAALLWLTVPAAREERRGRIWCFGASLSRLLPVVEINKEFSDFFNDPERKRLNGWQAFAFSTLGLVGWILGAILVAALSGLTR